MRCASCTLTASGAELRRFNHLFLCVGCNELAVKAEREINETIERARQMATNWLEDHILKGGLLAAGDGHGQRAAAVGGVPFPLPQVPDVRDPQASQRPGGTDPPR